MDLPQYQSVPVVPSMIFTDSDKLAVRHAVRRHGILLWLIQGIEAVIFNMMLRETQLLQNIVKNLFSSVAVLDVQHFRLPTIVDNPDDW